MSSDVLLVLVLVLVGQLLQCLDGPGKAATALHVILYEYYIYNSKKYAVVLLENMAKPFGTTVLDLRGIEGKGEGVLAKKTFKAGVEVLREDPLLYLSGKRSVCDSCLSEW